MSDSHLTNLNQIAKFLEGTQKLALKLETIEDKYHFIDQTVDRFAYPKLKRAEKRIILAYLKKLTGYKRAQLMRLVARAERGQLKRKQYRRYNPSRIYTPTDIKLLEETDRVHLRLNATATKEILRREAEVFSHYEYEHIAQVSVSHINNLRQSLIYKSSWVNPTKSREVPIGKTQPPEPNNQPGSIRVDTVHQNAVYHINSVDEITQFEVVVCVPQISERYLEPALIELLDQYPYVIFNFHSDRGSEFINKAVARLLNKLLVEQTKSRSRHVNDNALVESKNGTIVRKNMGYGYLDKSLAGEINRYYRECLNPYLNFHHPCLYAIDEIQRKGRIKKIYGDAQVPYEKLKQVSHELKRDFLKPGISFARLDTIAYRYSDNEFAKMVREGETKLFGHVLSMNRNNDSH